MRNPSKLSILKDFFVQNLKALAEAFSCTKNKFLTEFKRSLPVLLKTCDEKNVFISSTAMTVTKQITQKAYVDDLQ